MVQEPETANGRIYGKSERRRQMGPMGSEGGELGTERINIVPLKAESGRDRGVSIQVWGGGGLHGCPLGN